MSTPVIRTFAPLKSVHSFLGSSRDIWSWKSATEILQGRHYIADLKGSHERRHDLVDLHGADVLSQAGVVPGAKVKHGTIHVVDTFRVCQPSLRSILICVLPEDGFIALYNPGVDTDDCSTRYKMSANGSACWRHYTFVIETESWMHPKDFLDAGVEVR